MANNKRLVHSGRDGSSSVSDGRKILYTRAGPNGGKHGIGKKVKVRSGAKSARSYIIPKKFEGAQGYMRKK